MRQSALVLGLLTAALSAHASNEGVAAAIGEMGGCRGGEAAVTGIDRHRDLWIVRATLPGGPAGEPVLAIYEPVARRVVHLSWLDRLHPVRPEDRRTDARDAEAAALAAAARLLPSAKLRPAAAPYLMPIGTYLVRLVEPAGDATYTGLSATFLVSTLAAEVSSVTLTYPVQRPVPPTVERDAAVAEAVRHACGGAVADPAPSVLCAFLVLSVGAAAGGPVWFVEVDVPGGPARLVLIDARTGHAIMPTQAY